MTINADYITINPYLADLLAQPAALRMALGGFAPDKLAALRADLQGGRFSRILLTGMGSSLFSAYPAWLTLTKLGLPVQMVNAAELLHYATDLVDGRTLLWANSQSGRSVEVVRLLEKLAERRPAFQLSMSNDLESPMARSADLAVPIHAGAEATVSTKTYINMLSTLLLSATYLAGDDWQALLAALDEAAGAMESYLANWRERVTELDEVLGEVDQAVILGRGASLAAVWNGSLICKEAAKSVFEGFNAADFRHGPLELASPRLTALVFEGQAATASLNYALGRELAGYGAKVLWLASQPDPYLTTLQLPAVSEAARSLMEILPLQMLTLVMAQRTGFEPGKFRHVGKITTAE